MPKRSKHRAYPGKARIGLSGWSVKALAVRFRELKAEADRNHVEAHVIKTELCKRIPAGDTREGLQHRVSVHAAPDERSLAELGFLKGVQVPAVNAGLLKALVALHPELVKIGAVRLERIHALHDVSGG